MATPQPHSTLHVGVIMDGNGRWGQARGLSRLAGHEAGLERMDELYQGATRNGVTHLTVYAFSTENWRRSKAEVSALMKLFRRYIRSESDRLVAENIKVRFIGEPSKFPSDLIQAMDDLQMRTRDNTGLQLQVALNYGGRDEITRAANRAIAAGETQLSEDIINGHLDTAGLPMMDLVIRTSGEQRLSNFAIWQAAYAEYYFTDTLWPDFDAASLDDALAWYHGRERRFGKEA